jgi:hypothetical protein
MQRLFFRGNLSRTSSRYCMLGVDLILVSFSTPSHNSCKVASGCAFTAARRTASAPANLRAGPPVWGNGAHRPVLRFRETQRSIVGSLPWYRLPAAGILHSPRSTLATIRSRTSTEYAFKPPIGPSICSEFALMSVKSREGHRQKGKLRDLSYSLSDTMTKKGTLSDKPLLILG